MATNHPIIQQTIQDMDEVIQEANNNVCGQAAAVSKDLSKTHRITGRVLQKTAWINCHNIFDAAWRLATRSNPAGVEKLGMKH